MKRTIIIYAICLFSISLFAQVELGGTEHFTEVEADGTLEFHGDATVWNDYVVPFSSAKAKGTKPPVWEEFIGNIYQWSFKNEGDANKEPEVGFVIQMPHDWDGSLIYPHIHWSPEENSSGSVVWAIEYTWISYDHDTPLEFPSTTTLTGTSRELSSMGHKHLITEFGSITPSSNQNSISSILVVTFFRNSTNAADTYPKKAFALSFDIHYRSNTVGSRQEYIK